MTTTRKTTRFNRWSERAHAGWHRTGASRFAPLGAALLFGALLWLFLHLADDAPDGDYLALENRIMQSMRVDGAPIGGEAAVRRLVDRRSSQLSEFTAKRAEGPISSGFGRAGKINPALSPTFIPKKSVWLSS